MKINKRLPLLLLAAGILSPAVVPAQNQEVLSLKSCIEYSLKNHPNSTIYANEVKIAQQKKTEAMAAFLPQVNGSIAFDDNLKRQVTIIPAGAFSPTETRLQFGNQYNTNASVQLDQTIYDQTIFYAAAANETNKEIASLNVMQSNENLIYNTATAYYKVLTYNEQEKLLVQNEKKINDLMSVLKLQYEKGMIKKIDVDRVKVNLNNIQSQKTLLQTNKQLALNQLKFAMGMPIEKDLAINDSVDYSVQVTMPATDAFDISNRIDYRVQNKNITMQELDVKRRRAAYLPTLGGYARYGGQSFSNDFDRAFSNWFDYSSIGLKLNIPIFSGMRRHSQVEQSELTLLNARENMKLNIENSKLQHENSSVQLLNSYNSLVNNKENLVLAKDVFETTSLMYQKGSSSLSDFLNADYSYKESQTNYITSLLDFFSSRINYEKSKGTLTNYINEL